MVSYYQSYKYGTEENYNEFYGVRLELEALMLFSIDIEI